MRMNKAASILVNKGAVALLLLALATVGGPANALSTDRDQPANIEADDIEFDFRKGTRTYTNNVLVQQGTLRLKADKLHAIYENDELANATAWGKLARFKQRPDGKQHDVEGWASKIVVDQKKNTLTLIGKAALRQGSDTARGHTIVYNMANDTLRVSGGAKIGAGGKAGTAKPKRTIEDPFKDNPQGPPPVASSKTSASAPKAAEETKAEPETETEPEVKPTRSGRSRLIITPK